jgi:hypothetical protein
MYSHFLALLPCTMSFQDARAASIVMKAMKQIALSGRAVCATIHQPSVAIFSFDSLYSLSVVELSSLGYLRLCLILSHLERYDATPKIQAARRPGC